MTTREAQIESELALLSDPGWAGDYQTLSGHAWRGLLLAPASGFVYHSQSEAHQHWNHGDVVQAPADRIVLRPVIDPDVYGFGSPAKELVRVRWLGRDYLIESDDLLRFANDVNGGDPGAPSWYLSRGPGGLLDPNGPLVAPEPYRRYFLSSPVLVRVAAIHDSSCEPTKRGGTFYQVHVTLGAGAAQGLFVGMELWRCDPPGFAGADVESVQESSAAALVHIVVDADESYQPPSLEWVFSSRQYDEWFLLEAIRIGNEMVRDHEERQ